MPTAEQTRHDVFALIPGFGFYSTTTAAGTAATLVDAIALKSSVALANDYEGMYIFLPDDATGSDRVRRVASVTIASGTAVPDLDWSDAPGNGAQYEMMGICSPDELFAIMQRVLRRTGQPDLILASTLADGDMQTSGVTNWTATNSTRAKDPTAANVRMGTQSLAVTLTADLGYVLGSTRLVVPGQEIWAGAYAKATSGDTARACLWDVDNSVEFGDVVTSALDRYVMMEFRGTVPSNCDRVTVKLGGVSNGDVIYFGGVSGPWQESDNLFMAPSWAVQKHMVRRLRFAEYGRQTATANVYDAFSRSFHDIDNEDWDFYNAPSAANPAQIQLNTGWPYDHIYYESFRPASDYTTLANTAAGESVVIYLDRDYVAALVAKEVMDTYIGAQQIEADPRMAAAYKNVKETLAEEQRSETIQSQSQKWRVQASYRSF